MPSIFFETPVVSSYKKRKIVKEYEYSAKRTNSPFEEPSSWGQQDEGTIYRAEYKCSAKRIDYPFQESLAWGQQNEGTVYRAMLATASLTISLADAAAVNVSDSCSELADMADYQIVDPTSRKRRNARLSRTQRELHYEREATRGEPAKTQKIDDKEDVPVGALNNE